MTRKGLLPEWLLVSAALKSRFRGGMYEVSHT
jgi:hypothetical protein